MAIRTWGDARTEMLFEQRRAPVTMPGPVSRRARRVLLQIDAADDLGLLRSVPAYGAAILDEDGACTIPIAPGWSVSFLWRDGNAWFVRVMEA